MRRTLGLLTFVLAIAGCSSDTTVAPTALGATPSLNAQRVSQAPRFSAWSEPVALRSPINTPNADQSPALSPDGISLYLASDRPGTLGGVAGG